MRAFHETYRIVPYMEGIQFLQQPSISNLTFQGFMSERLYLNMLFNKYAIDNTTYGYSDVLIYKPLSALLLNDFNHLTNKNHGSVLSGLNI